MASYFPHFVFTAMPFNPIRERLVLKLVHKGITTSSVEEDLVRNRVYCLVTTTRQMISIEPPK